MARKKTDAWRLIKKDLPPDRAIAADPRLAGLEGNAPLRSILFAQHRLRARSSSAPRILDALYLLGLSYFLVFSFPVAAVMLCVFVLPLSAFQLRLRPQPAGRRGLAAVLPFGIGPRLMEDMLLSRVTASDFAVAFWASRLYSPTLGDGRRFYEAGLALLWIGIVAGLIHGSLAVYILPFALAVAAYHRTARGVSPYPALAAARRMARPYKALLEWRLEPMTRMRAFFSLEAWRKLLRDVFTILVPTIAGSLLLALLIYLVRRYVALPDFGIDWAALLRPPLGPVAAGVIGSAVGCSIGLIEVRWSMKRKEKLWTNLNEDLERVLALLRARIEEKGSLQS